MSDRRRAGQRGWPARFPVAQVPNAQPSTAPSDVAALSRRAVPKLLDAEREAHESLGRLKQLAEG